MVRAVDFFDSIFSKAFFFLNTGDTFPHRLRRGELPGANKARNGTIENQRRIHLGGCPSAPPIGKLAPQKWPVNSIRSILALEDHIYVVDEVDDHFSILAKQSVEQLQLMNNFTCS